MSLIEYNTKLLINKTKFSFLRPIVFETVFTQLFLATLA